MVVERVLLGLVTEAAKPCDGVRVRGVVELERVVHVHAAAPASDADLRPPEPDARAGSRHHPGALAVVAPGDQRKAQHVHVEPEGAVEIDDLEHELAHTGNRDRRVGRGYVRHT